MALEKTRLAFGVAGIGLVGYIGMSAGNLVGKKDVVGKKTDYDRINMSEETRLATFNTIAKTYDDQIHSDERSMGLLILRWLLMRNASGEVLEMGAGTGRNIKYLQKHGSVVTYCDQSENMLSVLEDKLTKAGTPTAAYRLKKADASELPFSDNAYDTVVETFGLCSYEDPIKVLKELQRVCKPDGHILLLEHGTGHYSWINDWLSSRAVKHAKQFGCIWNKPIDLFVKESGLDVIISRRYHFGTTYYYIARPGVTSSVKRAARGVFTESKA
eukprot:TRINITY_DN15217_c0_g1_i1.p1 TRINITY_DN15217_c0_g1~~TRINITY_DN15217_c0_g1_i1.p1  ORF type:complete len:272 (+),score=38.45 TRINITY_DN15217_c0_g1_i1:23-838(+)